jgi:hypothetical protein
LFDNKYSWFKSKLLRYRCTVLKELNGLSMSSSTSNDDIKFENVNNEKFNKEDDKEKEDAKIEENTEENKSVKVTVKFGNDSPKKPDIDLGDDEDENDNNDLQ